METESNIIIRYSQISLGSLSCFLDLLIIMFFIRAKFKRKATTGFELVFYLSICNFIKEVAYILNWEDDSLIDSQKQLNSTIIINNSFKIKNITSFDFRQIWQISNFKLNRKISDSDHAIENYYFNSYNFNLIDKKNEKIFNKSEVDHIYNYSNIEQNSDFEEILQILGKNQPYEITKLKDGTFDNKFYNFLIDNNSNLHKVKKDNITNMTISEICRIQGALMIYSDISNYAVASIISLYTYFNINHFFNIITWKRRIFLYIIGYIFPLIMAIISLVNEKIGINVHWCWINDKEINFIRINYIFVWFFILFNFIISYKILRYRYNSAWNQDQVMNNKGYSKKIIIYPIISIVFWLFYSINRLVENFFHDSVYILNVIVIYLNNFEGIIYSSIAAYGLKILQKIKKKLIRFCKYLKKSNGSEIERTSEIKYDDLLKDETKSLAETL